jgi:BirA family biotin operon repressor/biotin-[acetyl-CoA-carboxylase] ligase
LPTSPERLRVIRLDRCRSTNDYVREHLERLRADLPLAVCARSQSAGRGREGRSWSSPPGMGLYVTFAFRLADPRHLALFPLACGVAVCEALAAWTGRAFALKWPNDVLGDGRKVAGILCEGAVSGEEAVSLAGIGVNLNQREADLPEEFRLRAASLFMLSGREWPAAGGLERLAAALPEWLGRLQAGGAAAVVARARELTRPFLGGALRFRQGGREWRGVCRGLADDGGLRLETANGTETVLYSGEIVEAALRP